MKRSLVVGGLIGVLVGIPLILMALGGMPAIPSFEGVSLSSDYMPLDPVLDVLAMLAWAIWAYLALAIVLRVASEIASARRLPGHRALVTASGVIIPQPIRRMIDFAIGGALVAAAITGRSLASEAPPKAISAAVVSTSPWDAAPPVRVRPSIETRPYIVRAGDSLWRIAERELGSGFKWREIFALNKGKQFSDGRSLRNPRLILPGWTLTLPGDARAREASPRETQEEASRPDARPSLRVVQEPTSVQSMTHTTEITRSAPETPPPARAPVPAAPSKPILTLPSGGMIAASFGCGVLGAELLGRLRRRRARRLDEPLGDVSEWESREPKLVRELRHAGATPTASRLDVAVEALVDAWRSQRNDSPQILAVIEEQRGVTTYIATPEGSLPPRAGGRIGPEVAFEHTDGVVRATIRGPFPPEVRRRMTPIELGMLVPLGARRGVSVHAAALGLGTMSIEGADAGAAMKQMILSLAAPASPGDLSLFLIGDGDGALERLPHVTRSARWEEAGELLHGIQGELIRRARLLANAGDEWSSRTDELLPALVIVASAPPPSLRGVVEAIGNEVSKLGGTLFALGWHPQSTNLHIHAQEMLQLETDLPLPRQIQPFLLDEAQANDAIRVIAESQEDAQEAQHAEAPPGVVVPLTRDAEHGEEAIQDVHQPPESQAPQLAPIVVRCLGHFEVARDGEVMADGWRKKSRELLAYLVAHEKGEAKERIAEALWPGEEIQRGQRLFELAASFLRTQVRQGNALRYVEKVGDSFRLEPAAWQIDAWEFTRLAEEGLRNEGATAPEVTLRAAIALYHGEFCDDTYYEWAEPVRERYRSLFIRVCARLTDILMDSGRQEEALDILEKATEVDPLCEDLWRRAMLAEIALGRSAAALDRYGRLKSLLAKELEVEPDPATQRIARDIEVSLRRKPSHHSSELGKSEMTAARAE
jgi:DNA-binding SARP family transcriptional activator